MEKKGIHEPSALGRRKHLRRPVVRNDCTGVPTSVFACANDQDHDSHNSHCGPKSGNKTSSSPIDRGSSVVGHSQIARKKPALFLLARYLSRPSLPSSSFSLLNLALPTAAFACNREEINFVETDRPTSRNTRRYDRTRVSLHCTLLHLVFQRKVEVKETSGVSVKSLHLFIRIIRQSHHEGNGSIIVAGRAQPD